MDTLPPELLEPIFSHLPRYKDRAACSLVCRRWVRPARETPGIVGLLWVGRGPTNTHTGLQYWDNVQNGATEHPLDWVRVLHGLSLWRRAVSSLGIVVGYLPSSVRMRDAYLQRALSVASLQRLHVVGSGPWAVQAVLLGRATITDLTLDGRLPEYDFSECAQLRRLDLTRCESPADLSFLANTPALTCLCFSRRSFTNNLFELGVLSQLRFLSLAYCTVPNLSFVSSLPNLTHLDLTGVRHLTDLSPLELCEHLVELDLTATTASLQPLKALRSLRVLRLGRTSELQLGGLPGLQQLTSLSLDGCTDLRDIAFVTSRQVHRLVRLDLASCLALRTLAGLRGCVSTLSVLWAPNCLGLTDLTPLSACVHLHVLNLDGSRVADLSPLSHCVSLVRVSLKRCKAITTIAPLAKCVHLARVSLDSTNIVDLCPLAGCVGLERLTLRRCPANMQVMSLAHLPRLNVVCT